MIKVKSKYVHASEIPCRFCQTVYGRSEYRFRTTKGYVELIERICRTCKSIDDTRRRQVRKGVPRRKCWSAERYHKCLADQKGLCAVVGCGRPVAHADHCHKTGNARALLCCGCNVAIGLLKDNPERIEGVRLYVETWNAKNLVNAAELE
jgi:hypothetical protein